MAGGKIHERQEKSRFLVQEMTILYLNKNCAFLCSVMLNSWLN